MSALEALQRRFQRGVLGDGDSVLSDIASAGPGADPRQRLAVYGDAVQMRFLEVLRNDFPGVHALLGDADFTLLARDYMLACPSNDPSIRWFGRRFERHLASSIGSERPGVVEMARFEWMKGELHDAADSPIMTVDHMATVPAESWAGLRPQLVPALRRLDLHWNVPGLWVAMDAREALPGLQRMRDPQAWLLWRQDMRIRWRSLDTHEAWALDACASGCTFGAICEGLGERLGEDEAPIRAAGALKQWLNDGLIASA